jgi:hypothetical protein
LQSISRTLDVYDTPRINHDGIDLFSNFNERNNVKVKWINWTQDATENLVLSERPEAIFVESTIINHGERPFTIKYSLTCDPSWKVKTLNLELVETKEKIKLESDRYGNWSNDSGIIPKLHGAIDVDISATPFTNTLPIRRLKLGEKQHAEILVVYIKIPELSLDIDLQRYTCLSKDTFLFEQINRNFTRKIKIDKDGIVVRYPGLFKRI